jgi:ABC-type multidrug transport system fused ATPase/permease subunit
MMNFYVFLGLAGATIVLGILRAWMAFNALILASQRLHDRMLARLFRAPILFFDSNPIGRILNR